MTDRAPREVLRRAMHVLTGLALGASCLLLKPPATTAILAGTLGAACLLEILRRLSPGLHEGLARLSFGAMRPSESRGITGGTVLALGLFATWLLFPAAIAGRAIIVAATADPAASAIGTRFSARGRKTIAGTAACAVTAFAVLLLFHTLWVVAMWAALAAAAAERTPVRALDNLAVPLATAAVLLALQ